MFCLDEHRELNAKDPSVNNTEDRMYYNEVYEAQIIKCK